MKEMSLKKIIVAVFAFALCLMLMLSMLFSVIKIKADYSGQSLSLEYNVFDLFSKKVGADLIDDENSMEYFVIDKLGVSQIETKDTLTIVLSIIKVVGIVTAVVAAVGMILAGLSVLMNKKAANTLATVLTIICGAMLLILMILSFIVVGVYNGYMKTTSSESVLMALAKITTTMWVPFVLTILLAAGEIVFRILYKGEKVQSKRGVAKAQQSDSEDLTIELLTFCKKLADGGMISDIEFAEVKKNILIESNGKNVAWLNEKLKNLHYLEKYFGLFSDGVLTESEYNFKKKLFW